MVCYDREGARSQAKLGNGGSPEGFPQTPLPSGSSAGAAGNRQDAELSPPQQQCMGQLHSTDAQLHPWFQGGVS